MISNLRLLTPSLSGLPVRHGWLGIGLGFALLLAAPFHIHAAMWDGGGNNNSWGTANNWAPNGVPTFNNTVVVTNSGDRRTANFIAAARTIRALVFDANADTSFSIRLATADGGTTAANLTLGGGAAPYITIDAGASAAHTLGVAGGNVVLAGDLTVTHNGPANFTIDRPITGAFDLTKAGSGTLLLAGANTFSGDTLVSAGDLLVNGSLGGAGRVSATNSGTLGGAGTVSGPIFIYAGATLAPGAASIGVLTASNGVTFTGGTFQVRVASTNLGEYGQVRVTGGNVVLANATLNAAGSGYTPGANDRLWIINNTGAGALTGTFSGLAEGGTTNLAGETFAIYYHANFATGATSGGNDVLLVRVPPPACETQPATSVSNTTALVNGRVTVDAGSPCEYRFEYGTTTNYSTNTPWTGSLLANDPFSASLSGLQSNTLYQFRAQVRNANGTASGSNLSFRTGPPFTGWRAPDGFLDPNNQWDNEIRAFDTNTSTYASDTSQRTGWGFPITFTLNDPIRSDRLRVFSDFAYGVDMIRVEIQLSPSGVWTNMFQGVIDNQAWASITYPMTNISAARYTFHYTQTYTFWLYEFQFYESPAQVDVPVCDTLAATSPEETSGILHGQVVNEGGQPVEQRFQYGTSESYSTNTPWTGALVAGEEFSKFLGNLESNTTYHFRAQVKNSAGIGSGSNMTFVTGVPDSGWVSPSGYSDPSNAWRFQEFAFDDNVLSVAKCYHDINDPGWSPFLYLAHSPIIADKIRFYARDSAETTAAQVDVMRNGAWINVYSNAYTDRQWVEAAYARGTTTQARIRLQMGTTYGMDWELFEFDFYRVREVTLSGKYDGTRTVTLAVDGVARSNFVDFTTNVFQFDTAVGAGSRVLIYYNAGGSPTNGGALVTRATGQNMTDLDLSNRTLVVRSDYGGQLNNADLALAHTGAAIVPYVASGGNVSVTNRIGFHIPAGHAYAIGAGTLTVRDAWTLDGALDNTAGSVVFAGGTRIAGSAPSTFPAVTVSGSLTGSVSSMSVAGNWVQNGTFVHNNGEVIFDGDTTVSGSGTLSVKDVTITGTLTAPAGTLNVAGDWVNDGVFNHGNGTVSFNGASTLAGSAGTVFRHLDIAAGGSLAAPAGTLTVEGNWSKADTGSFTHNGGTVAFVGSGVSTSFGSTAFSTFQVTDQGKPLVFQAGTTQRVEGAFTVAGVNGNPVTLRSSAAGSKWRMAFPNGDQAVTYVDVRDSDALLGTVTVAGGVNSGNNNTNWIFLQARHWVGGAGNWSDTNHWALTAGGQGGASVPGPTHLVYFNASSGSGTCTINQPVSVQGFILDTGLAMTLSQGANSIAAGATGFEQKAGVFNGGSGAMTVGGLFKLTGGSFKATTNVLTLASGLTLTGGTFSNNNGWVEFNGSTVMNDTITNAFRNMRINGSVQAPPLLRVAGFFENNGQFLANGGRVRFEGATITGSSTTQWANVEIAGSLTGHSNLMTVSGSWTNNGTFLANNGTVAFVGGDARIGGTATSTYHHVRIDGVLSGNATRPIRLTGNWINNGTFNHNEGAVVFAGTGTVSGAGATFFKNVDIPGTLTLGSATVHVAGNWNQTGVVNPDNGTVIFNGVSAVTAGTTAQFNHLTLWGALTAPTGVISVAGDWVNDGTFTHNNGTVLFNGGGRISGANPPVFRNVMITGVVTGHESQIGVQGDWTADAGVFVHGGGRVVFSGSAAAGQTVRTGGAWNGGANNWKNNWNRLEVQNASTGGVSFAGGFKAQELVCATPNATLRFQPQQGATNVYEVAAPGGLNLQGASGQLIKLRRLGGATNEQWELAPDGGGWSASYLDVKDGINSYSNAIFPTASTDSGNNVNWFTATLVTLQWFKPLGRHGEVFVQWKTAAEANNAGFHIHRGLSPDGPYTRITRSLIPGLGTSTRGATYRHVDAGVTDGVAYYYKLEAVEFDGRSTWYGPEVARPGLDSDGDGMTDDWERFYGLDPFRNDANEDADGDGVSNLDEYKAGTNPGAPGDGPGEPDEPGPGILPPGPFPAGAALYKLVVTNDGIYRVTAAWLEAEGGVTNLADWRLDGVRLYSQGAEVPLRVHDEGGPGFGPSDFLEFAGQGLDTRFTDANVYWLYPATNAGALRMPESDAGSGGTAAARLRQTVVHEKNEMYWDWLPDGLPDDDHWFFGLLLYAPHAPPVSVVVSPVLENVSAAPAAAELRVAFRGINYSTPHHVQLDLNGHALTDAVWTGDLEYVHSAVVDQAWLAEGANTLTLTLPGDTGAAVEQVLVDRVEVDYLRDLAATDEAAAFVAQAPGLFRFEAAGFTGPEAIAFRVAGPTNVSAVTNLAVSGSGPFTLAFSDTAVSGVTYCVIADVARLLPSAIVPAEPPHLRAATNAADYIILAPDSLRAAMAPLAAFRAADGLRVRTVGLQDVYDDFNAGVASPYAIRDFLAYARQNWVPPAPRFVLLVGDASYDYRDFEGMGAGLLPVKMLHSIPNLETPSDAWYAALDEAGGRVSDVALGRFPARTPAEAAALVAKTLAYEAEDPGQDWARTVLLVADTNETRFAVISEAAAARVPTNWIVDRVYRADYPSAAACAEAITNGFNRGALLVNYAGHGAIQIWANEELMNTNRAARLTNGVRLPFVITPTCYNGYFIWPEAYDYESLAEVLIRNPAGGAIACLSPSGESVPGDQEALVEAVFQVVGQECAFRLGPAVARARQKVRDGIGDAGRTVLETFILFGDPALTLKQWPAGATGAPPAVLWTRPAAGAANVLAAESLAIGFDRPMDDLAARASFAIAPDAAGSFTWTNQDRALVWTPAAPLALSTTYTVTLLSNACDLAGRCLTQDVTFAFTTGTNTAPDLTDADADGLTAWQEVYVYGTDPDRADTDSDGLTDGDEALVRGTDPLAADTDFDGYADGLEVRASTDPLDASRYPSGQLSVAVTPLTAAWRFTAWPQAFAGPFQGQGSLALTNVPAGYYTLQYDALPDYTAPAPQTLLAAQFPNLFSAQVLAARSAGWHGAVPAAGSVAAFTGRYNRRPSILEGPAVAVLMSPNGVPVPFALTLHAADDEGDALVWQVATPASNGAASVSGAGLAATVHYQPVPGVPPPDRFVVAVGDAAGGTASVAVTVLFVDQGPVLGPLPSPVVELGAELAFQVTATHPHGVIPSLRLLAGPPAAVFTDHGQGTATFQWTPLSASDLGDRAVRVAASDGSLSDVQDMTIRVTTVQVTRPAGGPPAARLGGVCEVAWSGQRALGAVALDLWRGSNYVARLAASCASPSNAMTWRGILPFGAIRPGRDYRVSVTEEALPANQDASEPFAILLRPANDLDADGLSDAAVYDAASGAWYVLGSSAGPGGAWWGYAGAGPVPADYDGDGFNDFAVYEPAAGLWHIRSAAGPVLAWAVPWGSPAAVAVGGHYTASGVGDLAVYDTATACWFIRTVAGDLVAWALPWGFAGAAPVSGDYDGDGVCDLAVFDPASGCWFVRSVSGDVVAWAVAWGFAGAVPVGGDFDGDGMSDFAVYDPANALWYALSARGVVLVWALPWGFPGAVPVGGDYDGDGVSELAVYDPSAGAWYIRTVSGGVLAWGGAWGYPGAVPVGAAP